MKYIPIKTTKDRFYRQILEVLKSVPPINKLRPKELDTLAEIMRQNDKYSSMGAIKYTIIFSTEIRKEMYTNIGIKEASFNNNLSILRKYKVLNADNRLNQFFETIIFTGEFKLAFTFNEN